VNREHKRVGAVRSVSYVSRRRFRFERHVWLRQVEEPDWYPPPPIWDSHTSPFRYNINFIWKCIRMECWTLVAHHLGNRNCTARRFASFCIIPNNSSTNTNTNTNKTTTSPHYLCYPLGPTTTITTTTPSSSWYHHHHHDYTILVVIIVMPSSPSPLLLILQY